MSLASFTENNNTTDNEQTETTLYEHPSSSFDSTTQHGLPTTKPTYIHQLSIEVVAHIFARLDPISLTTVAKTCRYWRHIVTDDVCCK
jgi:hypothetical protein